MTTVRLPARIAAEMFSASGAQTVARLNSLVEHFAKQYALMEDLDALQAEALACIPAYRRPQS